jgi:hypothetical protein
MSAALIFRGVLLSWLMVSAVTASAQTTRRYENKLEEHVAEYVTRGECVDALKLVRAGLAANSPRAALLAGAMYEHGICLKPDWECAAAHYVIAHDGSEQAAAFRVAAGYAAPSAGPDVAAALWWMSQAEVGGGDTCAVEQSERGDPDRFVAALQKWTPAKRAACNYWAGVMATIAGEAQYPWERRPLEPRTSLEPAGKVGVRFTPGLATVDIWTVGESGLLSAQRTAAEALQLRASRKSQFEKDVRVLADRALARYPQPPGITPTWFYDLGITYASGFY